MMLFVGSITRNFTLKRAFAPVISANRTLSTSGSGDIRGAGGSFGKKEKAQEEQYFRQKEKEELEQFKKKLDEKKPKDSKVSKDPKEKK